jgi:AcrR family transcriptional regulator
MFVPLQVAFHTESYKNSGQGIFSDMVQKQAAVRRGRPRLYDPEVALERAIEVFWERGYSATSLDDLCAAMEMNRPSLYAAFGDKHDLFIKALQRYRERARARFQATFTPDRPLRASMREYYAGMLTRFFSGDHGPRGCFMMSVATMEAVQDPAIRAVVADGMRALDAGFEARFRLAREKGEIARGADPAALASLASGLVHSVAIRARAGEKRQALEGVIEAFLEALGVGPSPRPRGARSAGTS